MDVSVLWLSFIRAEGNKSQKSGLKLFQLYNPMAQFPLYFTRNSKEASFSKLFLMSWLRNEHSLSLQLHPWFKFVTKGNLNRPDKQVSVLQLE